MKLCVVVPSADYLKQAGVRIRYERIAPALEELGHSLSLDRQLQGLESSRA